MYELYVRESIDAGLADVAAGRTIGLLGIRQRCEKSLFLALIVRHPRPLSYGLFNHER